MDDIGAVLDSVGAERATLLGVSEGGRSARYSLRLIRSEPTA
jgi:hypothetical protein